MYKHVLNKRMYSYSGHHLLTNCRTFSSSMLLPFPSVLRPSVVYSTASSPATLPSPPRCVSYCTINIILYDISLCIKLSRYRLDYFSSHPLQKSQVFSTAADGQSQVEIKVCVNLRRVSFFLYVVYHILLYDFCWVSLTPPSVFPSGAILDYWCLVFKNCDILTPPPRFSKVSAKWLTTTSSSASLFWPASPPPLAVSPKSRSPSTSTPMVRGLLMILLCTYQIWYPTASTHLIRYRQRRRLW